MQATRWFSPARSWALAVVMLALTFADCAKKPSSEQEALQLEKDLLAAWQAHDTAAVAAIVADDFQEWSFKGERLNKAQLLRLVAKSEDGASRVEDPVVRVYGETAIYTARIIDSGVRATGEQSTQATCVTDVFVRRRSKWQMVASQEMLIGK